MRFGVDTTIAVMSVPMNRAKMTVSLSLTHSSGNASTRVGGGRNGRVWNVVSMEDQTHTFITTAEIVQGKSTQVGIIKCTASLTTSHLAKTLPASLIHLYENRYSTLVLSSTCLPCRNGNKLPIHHYLRSVFYVVMTLTNSLTIV